MIRLISISCAAILLCVFSGCATMDSPQGPFNLNYDFKVNGKDLTGTASNDFSGATPIFDGLVNGKDISFRLNVEGGPGGPLTVNYKGTLEKDQIKFNVTFAGNPPPGAPDKMELTARRVLE